MDYIMLAQRAIEQYDISVATITPIAQSGGAVFRVEDRQCQQYSLRIHIPKSETLEEIWTRRDVLDSELVWLDTLCRDTDLALPMPQCNMQGAYVTQVDGVNCTLLTWVPGEQKQYFTNEQELKSVAEMTATLHRQASVWQPPASFTRPMHDGTRVRHALDMLAERAQAGLLDAQDVQILEAAGKRAVAMLNTLPRGNMTWGVLHMDLLPANIVYVDGHASPIDFGACGYGFFLNDLAATFSFVGPSSRQQYIAWYGACFSLPDDYITQLEGLFVVSQLTSMIHFLGLPNVLDWLPTHMHKLAIRELGSYANSESFLFSGTPHWE